MGFCARQVQQHLRSLVGLAAFYAWARAKHFGCYYPRVGVSSEGIAVVLCVCVCDIKFFVLATTFSPSTRETPDLLSCCKKLSPLDR